MTGELRAPPRPPLPPPLLEGIDPADEFGNAWTWIFYDEILEAGGFSEEAAASVIANTIKHMDGAHEQLMLDPVQGIAGPRAVIDDIAERLGLNFEPRTVTITLPATARQRGRSGPRAGRRLCCLGGCGREVARLALPAPESSRSRPQA